MGEELNSTIIGYHARKAPFQLEEISICFGKESLNSDKSAWWDN